MLQPSDTAYHMVELSNIKTAFKFIACGILVTIGFFELLENRTKKVTQTQIQQIKEAISTICDIDTAMCTHIKAHQFSYRISYRWLPLPDSMGFNGAANHSNPDLYRITLSEATFDHPASLPVVLYHEMEHTRSSDVRYLDLEYRTAQAIAYCEDHNAVRTEAKQFAEKLTAFYVTSDIQIEDSSFTPMDVAGFHGNKLRDCTAL